jgi:hypothetical protein
LGLQASAIAIMTRYRMPPDSGCGYSPSRGRGIGRGSLEIADLVDRGIHDILRMLWLMSRHRRDNRSRD